MRTELRAAGWTAVGSAAARGRAFDGDRLLDAESVAARFDGAVDGDGDSLNHVADTAAKLEGFFGAVVTDGPAAYLVADGARSVPLYYARDGSLVSDRERVVADAVGDSRDPVTETEFLLTRYVTGGDTVWEHVGATGPGAVCRVEPDGVRRHRYRTHWPHPGGDPGDSGGPGTLRAGIETALDRVVRVADGRPVVVPLSGGVDSRLLASGLAGRGHEVIGFTFGRSGHPDVERSREVAARLGIDWEFVPYTQDEWAEWFHGPAGRRYRSRFGGDALPFLAEWPAVHRLVEEGRVPATALFCPGHTVATPGERLPRFDAGAPGSNPDGGAIPPTVDALVGYILDTHYSLWEWDSDAFRTAAAERIRRGLLGDRPPEAVSDPETAAAAYERWEWIGRMSTFTNGDLRVYDDAGVDWWLPLWDPAYVSAWCRLPAGRRREKSAHASLAAEYYRTAADVPAGRAGLTDRDLPPADRLLSLVRHTPVRQFTERDGAWDPPFTAPREAWSTPGSHPLAWYGAIDPEWREAAERARNVYSLRTLEATGRLDFADPDADLPPDRSLTLPADE
jgi:asparagine synthase (glutamine-hydrolysing)